MPRPLVRFSPLTSPRPPHQNRTFTHPSPEIERTLRMAGNLVGIDLGTTFSAIASLDDQGRPVHRDPQQRQPACSPPAPSSSWKTAPRWWGRPRSTRRCEQPEPRRPARQAAHGREDARADPVAGRDFRPETVSAIILRKLVQDAEARIGPDRPAPSSPCPPTSTSRAARPPRTRAASPASTCWTSSTSRRRRRWPTRSSPHGRCTARQPPCRCAHDEEPDRPRLRPRRRHVRRDRSSGCPKNGASRRWPSRATCARRQGLGRRHRKPRRRRLFQRQHGSDPRSDRSRCTGSARRRRAGQALAEQAAAGDASRATHAGKVLTRPDDAGRVRVR